MSDLMVTMQMIVSLQRNLSQQTEIVEGFLQNNHENIELVISQLEGSKAGYDIRMVNALMDVQNSLRESAAVMDQANEALKQVTRV